MPCRLSSSVVVCAVVVAAGLGLVPRSARAQLVVPKASSLGFDEARGHDPLGRPTLEYRDRQTGYRLITAEGPGEGVSEQSVYDSTGVLVYHSDVRPDGRRSEGRIPRPWSSEIRAQSDGSFLVIESRTDDAGKTVEATRVEGLKAMGCDLPKPISDTELTLLLQSSDKLVSFAANHADFGKYVVRIGSNTVAKNCDKYGAPGLSGVVQALTQGLDHGLRCLANLAQTHPGPLAAMWRMHAAQILGYFNSAAPRHFTIACESTRAKAGAGGSAGDHIPKDPRSDFNAMALMCQEQSPLGTTDDYPGIAINMAGPSVADPAYLASALFHEMVHHLGYLHDTNVGSRAFDAVYNAQFCCFPESLPPKNRESLSSFTCDEITHKGHGHQEDP